MDRTKETAKIQARAQKAWEKFQELFPRLLRRKCPIIILNGRYTTSAGMCYQELHVIHLSLKYYLFNKREMLEDTLIHELAHSVDFCLNGLDTKLQGHGPKWQNIMLEYGLKPTRYHEMTIPKISLKEMLAL